MALIVRFLCSRVFLAFLGVLFLALFIWYAGPLISFAGHAPLADPPIRLSVIGGLFGLWMLATLWRYIRSRRRNAAMMDALAVVEPSPGDAASAEERELLQSKMQEAVDTLKQRDFSARSGSRFVYELPWYVIIGPPAAGKSTLLANSGLDFPLEESHGRKAVKGVGGTRNCDWWFTDQAVLLDTAGRYVTQDSDATVDRSAWESFLELLRQRRRRRPLNGVFVAISVQDLLQMDDDALLQCARTVRARIDELYQRLGIAPPVYLLFTKCDLLAGFNEFFADLDAEARDQVWGFTLPVDQRQSVGQKKNRKKGQKKDQNTSQNTEDLIGEELDRLGQVLHAQTLDKLEGELAVRNREFIYGFPMQFTIVRERARRIAQFLSSRTRLMENVRFRGVYFTSATQTGSVLDQVISRVSQGFGLRESLDDRHAESGRSYFISRLLNEVVFPEAGLAGTSLRTERRLRGMQVGAASGVAVLLLALLMVWTFAWYGNRAALARVDEVTGSFIRAAESLNGDNLDLVAVDRLLNRAHDLQFARAAPAQAGNLLVKHTGLYQGRKLDRLADNKYRELLIDALLPRLMVRLENQMHQNSADAEFLFEALKTYLMLDDHEHFSSDAVIGWFNYDFDTRLQADVTTRTRESLKRHVRTLFTERPQRLPRPIDRGLVQQYRQLAAGVSTEQRTYDRIRATTIARQNTWLRMTSVAGPEIPQVLTRRDGVSIDQSIPLLFTRDGYHEVFLPASRDISATLADDVWVLGDALSREPDSLSVDRLQASVTNQYHADYIATWDALIGALELRPVDGLSDAAAFISLLSAVDSPLKKLLVAMADETTLTVPPPAESDAVQGAGASTDRETTLGRLLEGVRGPEVDAPPAPVVIDPVTEHFEPLHALVADWESNASSLDQVLAQLAQVNLQLLPMAQSPGGPIDPQLSTELAVNLQTLETQAGRLPQPLASLVDALTNDIGDVVGGGLCQQLETAWRNDVVAYYQRAIRNRYPVSRQSSADITLTDFAAFFGPGGVVDNYVNTYLTRLVSRTPGRWSWVGTGSAVCLSASTLAQLANADDIKKTFFGSSTQTPGFSFNVIPERLRMSPDIDQLLFDVGGSRLEYFHGPVAGTTSFIWPTATNDTRASVQVLPVVPGASSSLATTGPWAILRLLDLGQRSRDNGGLSVSYSFSGRDVQLSFATSSFNPLDSPALHRFYLSEQL